MSTPTMEADWRPEVVPGERIFLSHIRREDVPLLARWYSDLELTTYVGAIGRSFTLEQEQEWFDAISRNRDNVLFAIVVREEHRLIGSVELKQINHQRGTAELGISIGDKACWGQGYGSEAARLMVDYGFTFLNLYNIHLWYLGFNERGHHAYLKAGFKPAGRLRGGHAFNGRRYDTVLMDVTRDDFGPSQLSGMLDLLQEE